MAPRIQPRRSADPESSRRTKGKRKSRIQTLIPLLFLLAFVTIVLYNTVPAVRFQMELILTPESAQAKASCREHALAQSETPGFARIVEYGTVNRLPDGFYVEGLVIGEMSQTGIEAEIEVTCYVDRDGRIVKSARRPYTRRQADPDEDDYPLPGQGLKR